MERSLDYAYVIFTFVRWRIQLNLSCPNKKVCLILHTSQPFMAVLMLKDSLFSARLMLIVKITFLFILINQLIYKKIYISWVKSSLPQPPTPHVI